MTGVDLPSLGVRLLLAGDHDLSRFEQPARGAPGVAAAVAQPESIAELRDLVRRASDRRIRLLAQGANTGLVGASVPTVDGDTVVVSLDRFRRIEVSPHDSVAVVGAGTRLSELNAAAAEHGLQLPVDLAADPSLGGMVATNTGGSRVMRYGPMRNHVLGAEAVTAGLDAAVLGRLDLLRKDSRGLDTAQLLVGSGGTLGIVTDVVVSLVPIPRRTETWWLALEHPLLATELLAALEALRPGRLSAFEFVSCEALERTVSGEGSPANPFGAVTPAGAVLAEWSAPDESSLDELESDVGRVFEQGLVTDGRLVEPAVAWAVRHRVSESLRAFGTVWGHDISMPRTALMLARDEAIRLIAEIAPHAVVCDFGHVGDGGLHLNVLVPAGLAAPSELRVRVRNCIDDVVARHGGSYSAEHGLGPLNADRWLATASPIEQRVVAAVKSVVDPFRILGHPRHPYNRLPLLEHL